MHRQRTAQILLATLAAEAGAAGYGLGHGASWLFLAVAALAAADAARSLARGALAPIAGLEIALVLALVAATAQPPTAGVLALLACLAWMLGPARATPPPTARAGAGAVVRSERPPPR